MAVPAVSVLRVAGEMVTQHRFDGEALAKSYADVAKRGHLQGTKIDKLEGAFEGYAKEAEAPARTEIRRMLDQLPSHAERASTAYVAPNGPWLIAPIGATMRALLSLPAAAASGKVCVPGAALLA